MREVEDVFPFEGQFKLRCLSFVKMSSYISPYLSNLLWPRGTNYCIFCEPGNQYFGLWEIAAYLYFPNWPY